MIMPPDLSERIERLEHQSGTILALSALNMLTNVITIMIGFWIGMS
jgi:hypothetical protein